MIKSLRLDRIVNNNLISLSTIDNHLCEICDCIPLFPEMCANLNCSRYFCHDCISSFNLCTFCNHSEFTDAKDEFLKIFKNVKFSCINVNAGCNQEIYYDNIIEHENTLCDYSITKCSRFCNYVCVKADMPNHQLNCANVEIKCKQCDFLVVRKKFNEHSESCQKQSVNCAYCGKEFMHSEINSHNAICSLMEVNCKICNRSHLRTDKTHNCFITLTQKSIFVQSHLLRGY